MSNPLHLDKLMEGVEAWNRWRQDHSERPDLSREKIDSIQLSGVDLSYANLSGSFFAPKVDLKMANLDYADLTGAWLTKADLRGSMMQYANLFQVHLAGADLTGSQLYSARFICALLEDATFCGSDLGFAHFSMELMRGADLSGASIGNTVFSDSDLSDVKGLESIDHRAPSTVGIDTIYRSKGRIPEKFLRRCGVPDEFIAYAKSLVANRIEFYSCFISYSTKDQAFADRLYADLQNKGVRCWFAPHDVQGGRKLHEQIDEAIRLHDKLLLILSPHSMESEWVKTEIAKARKREVRDPEGVLKRRVLFPIRLAPFETLRDWECFDADTGKDSAREIREYFIPDFSNWENHDSYQEAFQRLISDLKASDPEPK